MKKVLLAAAVAATFAGSALAEEGAMYFRADAGAAMNHKQTNFKRGQAHPVVDLGVGTYLMDNMRAELVLGHHLNADQKAKKAGGNKLKHRATHLMVKGLVDVADFGAGKVFLGAGVGMAQIKAKNNTATTKKANNFAYTLTAGSAFDVAEGVKLDVAYSYLDAGKDKAFKDGTKPRFRAHNLTAGVRFEL